MNRHFSSTLPSCGTRENERILAIKNPHLAKEWHPTKNGDLTPFEVTYGSKQKVWWLGQCGHEWESSVVNRNSGRGCKYCSGNGTSVLKGFNDMWTTNPALSSMLANPEDGYKYTQRSGKKVDWKCSSCDNIIADKVIASVNNQGLHCPLCADGVSFGEKFVYVLLTLNNIKFKYDSSLLWSGKYRYDFYLEDYNWIIEVHGIQHYEEGFNSKERKRTLEFEKQNDIAKENLAMSNSISKYIVIDARKSTGEFIYKSIMESELVELIPNINLKEIAEKSNVSFVKIVSDLWNSGMRNAMSIANQINFGRNATIKYLKTATEIGWCDYDPVIETSKNGYSKGKQNNKEIVQLTLDGEFLREWHSNFLASEELKISKGNISSVCNRIRPTAGGFRWMFKEDYNKL